MPILSIAAALWGNPWTRLAAVAVACLGIGFVKGFASVPRVDVAAVERNAIAGRDAVWKEVLAEKERQSEAAVAAALEAGRAEPATSPDRAERLRQCAASPTCRDRSK